MKNLKKVLLLFFNFHLLASLAACGVRIEEVKPVSITSYQHFSDSNGLRASADMFKDEARLNTYFGDNLLKKGILPVFVAFENNRAKGGYVLLREQSKFTAKVNSRMGSQDDSYTDVMDNNPVERPGFVGVGLAAATVVLNPIVSIASLFAVGIWQGNKERVFHNIQEKQMIEKAVYPGERHSGFIYFKIEEDEVENIGGIILTIQNLKTQEMEQLVISLQ